MTTHVERHWELRQQDKTLAKWWSGEAGVRFMRNHYRDVPDTVLVEVTTESVVTEQIVDVERYPQTSKTEDSVNHV